MNPPPDESPSSVKWHDVAAEDQLPPGTLLEAVVGDAIVALANVQGELFALDGICAHQGGPLGKGRLEQDCLTCPWHGWQYDVRSGQQLLSSHIAQRRFAVRVVAGRIQIGVESSRPS